MTTTAKTPAKATPKPRASAAAKVSPAATKAQPAAKAKANKPAKVQPKPYILLTGVDDEIFCTRVSEKLKAGYELYGSPSVTFNGKAVIAAQALVLKKSKKHKK